MRQRFRLRSVGVSNLETWQKEGEGKGREKRVSEERDGVRGME